MTTPFQKAKTLLDVRRQAQLEPLPADDARYVPLDAVRGQHVVKRFLKLLEDDSKCMHIAYAGHRGCGKTTELFRLKKEVERTNIYCAYLDAHPELIMGDLEYTDVLLYIAQKIIEDVTNSNVSLNTGVLKAVEDYFTEVTKITRNEIKKEVSLHASAEAAAGIPWLGKLLAGINARIAGSSAAATELRTRLKRRPDHLIDAVNQLLGHVSEQLGKTGKSRLLLILDSLDRLQPKVIEQAVLREARLIAQLKINLILTVPLAAIYMPGGETLADQGVTPLTLPMVAVRDRDQPWNQVNTAHVAKLSELISTRVDVATVFQDPAIIREMVLLSGGSFRELFDLLAESAMAADETPITHAHFETAARQVWNAFKAPLQFDDRDLLLEIHREKAVDHREKTFRLLFHRFALEYNGHGWADVHPLVMKFDERFATPRTDEGTA